MNANPAIAGLEPGPYVITFSVSFERMPLVVPFVHELAHCFAFRSHAVEHGRDVFRLHVGYFESRDAARPALRVVQRHYTDAHIATAPNRGLGSLDDTGITEFSIARHGSARAETAGASARSAGARAHGATAVDPGAALCDGARQRFAIQLDVLRREVVSTIVPELEEFRARMVYRIQVPLDGAPHQALRLGFFPSLDAVNGVLPRIRANYPAANIVPVSAREYARVSDLAVCRERDDGARRVTPASGSSREPDDEVSCEFGPQELAIAGGAMPYQLSR